MNFFIKIYFFSYFSLNFSIKIFFFSIKLVDSERVELSCSQTYYLLSTCLVLINFSWCDLIKTTYRILILLNFHQQCEAITNYPWEMMHHYILQAQGVLLEWCLVRRNPTPNKH